LNRHHSNSVTFSKEWQASKRISQDLETQIQVLRDQERTARANCLNLAQKATAEEKLAYSKIAIFAAPQCRQLCEAMYDKLPRELRDMVYAYILNDELRNRGVSVATHPSSCSTRRSDSLSFYPKPHKCKDGICAKHFMDLRYTGGLVGTDIVESFLSEAVFDLEPGWEHLPYLLNSDRWCIGSPAYRYIRWIDIHVDEDMLFRWQGDDLSKLDALRLMRPAAWPVLFLDLNSHDLEKFALIQVFERVLSKLWDYIMVLNLSRLDIEVRTSTNGLDSVVLMSGSPEIADWTSKLKRVSTCLITMLEQEANLA
jgi:hypothetical protein